MLLDLNKSHNKLFFKGSLPIFILAGVVLFVALILEIVRLTVFAETGTHITKAKMESHRVIPSSENVFENIHKQYPNYKEAIESLVKYDVKFMPHNYVQGNYKSKVKVVLFNDNSCKVCMQEQARILRQLEPYKDQIVIIFKHMPSQKNEESLSAMFGQIAVREGVYEKFLTEMSQNEAPMESAEDYFELLNKVGIGLDELRAIMTHSMTSVLKDVGDDIDMAVKAGAYSSKAQPVVYVNGYKLGANYLPQYNLTMYIDRLLNGETIIPTEGFEEK